MCVCVCVCVCIFKVRVWRKGVAEARAEEREVMRGRRESWSDWKSSHEALERENTVLRSLISNLRYARERARERGERESQRGREREPERERVRESEREK